MGALYPDSVPVVVEGISSGQHPEEVRKTSYIKKSFNKAGFEACACSSAKSVSSGAEVMPTSSRQIKTFSGKLEKLTSDPQILELVEDYQIPFSSEPKHMQPLNPVHLIKKEET